MRQFFKKRGYPDSAVTTGKHCAQEIDRETALQTSQNEENNGMVVIQPLSTRSIKPNFCFKNEDYIHMFSPFTPFLFTDRIPLICIFIIFVILAITVIFDIFVTFVKPLPSSLSVINHKNYNFLNCDCLKNSYFPLIHLPSFYRTVCYRTACYRTVCYRTVQQTNHIQSCSLNQQITYLKL